MRYSPICLVPALLLAAAAPAQKPTLIRDMNPTRGSYPLDFHRHEGLVFFTADDGTHGRELWRSDGTPAGTFMVQDSVTGITSSDVREITSLGKLLLFHTTDSQNGRDLWATEGTAATTRYLTKIHFAETISLIALGDVALFSGRSSNTASPSLWRTDGTAKGTFELKLSKPLVAFTNPYVFQGRVYFGGGHIATNNIPDVELWVTDGTASGTQLVADIQPGGGTRGPYSSFPQDFVAMGGTLYFHARSLNALGPRLWRTDGTAQGTVLVNPVSPISAFHGPHDLVASGNKLFFGLNSRLWVSDGTTNGTQALGPTFNDPRFGPIAAFQGGVLFTATTTAAGSEIWGSDGNGIGMTDIEPGSGSSNPSAYARIGVRSLFFSAFNQKYGYELWSVGRNLRPVLLHDINTATVTKDTGSSQPYGFTMLHGRVLFAADDGKTGHELWSLFPGATSEDLGYGCGPNGQAPVFSSSEDPVLGQPNTYTVTGAPASAGGLLLLGPPANPSVGFPGGCRLYPDPNALILLPLQTQSNGATSIQIQTPNNSGLVGLTAAFQAVIAASSSQLAFTNNLELTPGQ